MHATERWLEDAAVLELKGTVRGVEGDRELDEIFENLANRGCVRLVINLREVTHIDTMCLGAFITGHVKFHRRGGAVHLLQTPPRIRQLLAITRLDQFLPTFATEEEAIRNLPDAGVCC
jgi:anti-anti-sigma factor